MIKRIPVAEIPFRWVGFTLPDHLPAASDVTPRFSLAVDIPTAYRSNRYEHPTTKISFTYPADDAPRVRAWFTGDYSSVSRLPSTTLLRNLTTSLHTALDAYVSAANFQNLFTSPFMAAVAVRLASGKHRYLAEPVLMEHPAPASGSPVVAVRDYTLLDQGAQTYVELFNLPSRLLLRLEGTRLPADAEAIDIVAAPQASLYDASRQATDISSVDYAGEKFLQYNYPRYSAEQLRILAAGSTDFRILASLAPGEIPLNEEIRLELADGTLVNWKTLPKLTLDPGQQGGTEPGTIGGLDPSGALATLLDPTRPLIGDVHIETAPIDMGMPEKEKWMRGVTLRGIFCHREVRLSLYGAHHLEGDAIGEGEGWRLVARSEGAILRRLRGVRYRWWKVGISLTMKEGDRLDALVFDFS